MPKPLKIALPLLAIAGLIVFLGLKFTKKENVNQIRLSGNIEITQVDVSFKIQGRLIERQAEEGQSVIAGQTLARLDAIDYRLRVSQAMAEVDYAQAVLTELEAGSRKEEIDQAAAQLEQVRAAERAARSRLDLASIDLKRNRTLLEEKVISQRAYDEIQTRQQTSQDTWMEAQAQVERAQAALTLIKAGPRRELIDQARARLNIAKEGLALAKAQLEDTVVKAPFDGIVLSKAVEPGAFLNPGAPVLTLGRLDLVFLRAFIEASDLGKIKLGQEVAVGVDSFPDKRYPGRVGFIAQSAEFTPKTVQTNSERIKLMYRIKIELKNPDYELKAGMPADAFIELK